MTDEFVEAQSLSQPDDDDNNEDSGDIEASSELLSAVEVIDNTENIIEVDHENDDLEQLDSAPSHDQPSLLTRVLALFGVGKPSHVELQERLDELSRMIRHYPDEAENYVLRGEIHLQLNGVEYAHDDFQKALEILENRVKTDRWGIIAQVMQDRAFVGLTQAQHRLA